MNKFLSAAGAIAALALSGTQVAAATPSAQAAATAKIYKPLTISKAQDLDFGTIVLVGASFANEVVTVPTSGPVVCGGGANVTCSGTPTAAKFHLVGSNNAAVTVNSPAFSLTGPATLTYTGSGRLSSVLATPFALTGTNVPPEQQRCVKVDLSGRPVSYTGVCP